MAHIRVHICCVIRTLADGSGRRPSSGWSHHAYSICLVIVGRYSIELNIEPSSRLHKIIIYRATTCVALSEREILIIATNQHPLEHCVPPHLWLRLAGRNRSIGINRICSDRTKQNHILPLPHGLWIYAYCIYIYNIYVAFNRNKESRTTWWSLLDRDLGFGCRWSLGVVLLNICRNVTTHFDYIFIIIHRSRCHKRLLGYNLFRSFPTSHPPFELLHNPVSIHLSCICIYMLSSEYCVWICCENICCHLFNVKNN